MRRVGRQGRGAVGRRGEVPTSGTRRPGAAPVCGRTARLPCGAALRRSSAFESNNRPMDRASLVRVESLAALLVVDEIYRASTIAA